MALTRFFSATPIFLLSLLVIASATDYSYDSKPDTVSPRASYNVVKPEYVPKPKPKDTIEPVNKDIPKPDVFKPSHGHNPKPNPDIVKPKPNPETDEPKLTVPKRDTVKPNDYYNSKPKPEIVKPDDNQKPNPETVKPKNSYNPKPNLRVIKPDHIPKPNLETAKPGTGYGPKQEKPLPIGIEGVVLCHSGSTYAPMEGAVVKITCKAVDQDGYDTKPVSCLSGATDAKGYFFKTLDSFGLSDEIKLTECKAYLEKSPSENCKFPTDVNKGITGALLSSFRILDDKHFKLYSVGPFFYTSNPANPGG